MGLNIKQASEKLDMPESTIRSWSNKLNLSIPRNSHGNRTFSENDIELLKQIKDFRNNGNGFNTIQKKLNLDESYNSVTSKLHVTDIQKNEYKELDNKISLIEGKLTEIIELSEKYSRATYQIGKLESDKENLLEKVKLLNSSTTNLYTEIDNKENKIMELEEKNKEMQKQLELEQKKTWWQRLLKK